MIWLLVRKDLLLESRTKEITISMLAFGLTMIMIYALAFSASPAMYRSFAPGLFWVIILFASALGLHRMFVLEKEFDAFSLSISAPVDRGIIFLAKWISGTILLIISETVIIPPFVIFMVLSLPDNWLILIFIIIIGASFIPWCRPYISEGFQALETAPDWFTYAMYASIAASFGIRGIKGMKK